MFFNCPLNFSIAAIFKKSGKIFSKLFPSYLIKSLLHFIIVKESLSIKYLINIILSFSKRSERNSIYPEKSKVCSFLKLW